MMGRGGLKPAYLFCRLPGLQVAPYKLGDFGRGRLVHCSFGTLYKNSGRSNRIVLAEKETRQPHDRTTVLSKWSEGNLPGKQRLTRVVNGMP